MPSKLTEEERKSDLKSVLDNGWQMDSNGRDAIMKKYQFKDFNQAFGFMTRVALKADKMDHHPGTKNPSNYIDIVHFNLTIFFSFQNGSMSTIGLKSPCQLTTVPD